MSPNEASITRKGLHLIELLAKVVSMRISQRTQDAPKATDCSPPPDAKAKWLKTTPTQHIELGEAKLMHYLEYCPLCPRVLVTLNTTLGEI